MRKVRKEVRRRVIGKEERGGAEEERGEEQLEDRKLVREAEDRRGCDLRGKGEEERWRREEGVELRGEERRVGGEEEQRRRGGEEERRRESEDG